MCIYIFVFCRLFAYVSILCSVVGSSVQHFKFVHGEAVSIILYYILYLKKVSSAMHARNTLALTSSTRILYIIIFILDKKNLNLRILYIINSHTSMISTQQPGLNVNRVCIGILIILLYNIVPPPSCFSHCNIVIIFALLSYLCVFIAALSSHPVKPCSCAALLER